MLSSFADLSDRFRCQLLLATGEPGRLGERGRGGGQPDLAGQRHQDTQKEQEKHTRYCGFPRNFSHLERSGLMDFKMSKSGSLSRYGTGMLALYLEKSLAHPCFMQRCYRITLHFDNI
jgi:hypothetical protein